MKTHFPLGKLNYLEVWPVKKYYTVEIKGYGGEYRPNISATAVSLQYAKGFCAGLKSFHPCPAFRIVEFGDSENIIIEDLGNSKPTTSNNQE